MNLFRRRALQSIYLCALSLLLLIQQIAYNAHLKSTQTSSDGTKYIKWIDFDISSQALTDAVKYDVESKNSEVHTDAVTLLSLLATKYGGSFKSYKKADMDKICEKLRSGEKPEDIAPNLKTYNYYKEAYGAVLGGLVGEYAVPCDYEESGLYYEKRYGLKLFSPIAAFISVDFPTFGRPAIAIFKESSSEKAEPLSRDAASVEETLTFSGEEENKSLFLNGLRALSESAVIEL